jgi:hypothetical protein
MVRKLQIALLVVASLGPLLTAAAGGGGGGDSSEQQKPKEYFQKPGAKVSEIIRARGYLAEEHTFITDDGYVLGMTRALNPLIGRRERQRLRREPLLFVHGTLVDGNSFVMNSFDIEQAKDFTDVDADQLSEDELVQMFQDEPSAKSLVFFALNFGHEVWILHRRGSPMSQRRVDLPPDSPRPATVMEKYLASVAANSSNNNGQRQEAPQKRRRTTGGKRSERHHKRSAATGAAARPPQEQQSGPAQTNKDHSKVIETAEAAPPALLDYGNLAMDIKVSLDRRLWNHSFDEQAAYDLPRAVDYVLDQSGHQRVALVGDSSGGSLIMMSLVLEQELNDKRECCLTWSMLRQTNINTATH